LEGYKYGFTNKLVILDVQNFVNKGKY